MKQDLQAIEMGKMQDSLEGFYKALQFVEKNLTEHKNIALAHTERIFGILHATDEKLAQATALKDGASGLQSQMSDALQVFKNSIGKCRDALEKKAQIRQELEEVDEKARAIVIVFGRTNAGKSTLGNFLRGKSLRNAVFDNPWKRGAIVTGSIQVIESVNGQEKESVEQREWFKEGASETTQEIQCFTLPGLLWVDTPGIGSINDETLGNIARKYADNADLVIYLDHSDNPGLTSLSGNLIKLLQNGQETLIVNNQSDKNFPVKDANGKSIWKDGKPLQTRKAKPEEDRRAQEKQEIKSLLDKGFSSQSRLQAMSISMLLANMAVETNDDELYADSAVGKFLTQLQEVFASPQRIKKIMSRHLYSACLDLCNMALDGSPGEFPGISSQLSDQEAFLDKIKKLQDKFDLEAETRAIATPILLESSAELRKLLNELEATENNTRPYSASSGMWEHMSALFGKPYTGVARSPSDFTKEKSLNLTPVLGNIQRQCNELVSKKITEYARTLFDSVEFKNIVMASQQLEGLKLERKKEIHEYEVPESYYYRRSPSGFIEHVCAFFGKTYTGVGRKMVKKTQEIDLGYNTDELYGQVEGIFEKLIPKTVQLALEEAKADTLDYAQKKVEDSVIMLKEAEKQIAGIKQELEKEVSQMGEPAC